jgi:hypothetical protein
LPWSALDALSCNAHNDLWVNPGMTISASNNRWDHVPPTTTMNTAGGIDIRHGGTATVIVTGALLAPDACP